MEFTYYGHSCFSVLAGGKRLLFDPFITGNELAKNINIEEIEADYIFVSHGHFDHILDVTVIAARTGAKVIGSWELYNYFNQQGVKDTLPLNPGGKVSLDFGVVKAVAAQHSSSFSDGSYAGTASGFIITSKDGNFYYSGDTALTLDMTLIKSFAHIDFAVFPIGDMLTMGIDDAIQAAKFVETTKVIGVHYDTFGFIKIDQEATIREFSASSIILQLPKIGDRITIEK
ncbi:L-ascorbate metabolism protein UlaG (beta-lactamase superfamily) [Pedobacter cryoconitis]|uniref:L-ascorbate metabolism protein UlaG (Beta-lactamase superfamily) n=1 Tax=Pedobacter cryoconitis TaxID=188932 RepID=A0A7W8ZQV2_9SPHI|nr:metal-dependent hydrolase [Pedobacter cryoconitis]MBB5638325.1 L-ascorbate metabolism protein UlaG (beta-lactamase superfamily) [Pedobacter cryoconitis]